MQTRKVRQRYWVVEEGTTVLAEFILDYWFQMDEIVFRTKDELQRRRIRELVFTHAARYQKNRTMPVFGGIMIRETRNASLTEANSDEQMNFDGIPKEVAEYDDDRMNYHFGHFPIHFTDGDFPNHLAVLDKVVAEIQEKHGVELTYAMSPNRLRDTSVRVAFEIKSNHQFRVWKSVNKPNEHIGLESDWCLSITPSYHPHFDGAQSVGLINGDTDAFIGRHEFGVDSVYSPLEAQQKPKSVLSASWSHLNHPFYGEGKTLGMQISVLRVLSTQGYELLVRILTGALNLEKLYLEVSGGFTPPYPYPHRSRGHKEVRGSEHSVFWEYITLEREGKLEGSLIPGWFLRERWLDAFPREVSRP